MKMAGRHGASNASRRYSLDKEDEDGWGPDAARWVAGRRVQGIRDGDGEKAGTRPTCHGLFPPQSLSRGSHRRRLVEYMHTQ